MHPKKVLNFKASSLSLLAPLRPNNQKVGRIRHFSSFRRHTQALVPQKNISLGGGRAGVFKGPDWPYS